MPWRLRTCRVDDFSWRAQVFRITRITGASKQCPAGFVSSIGDTAPRADFLRFHACGTQVVFASSQSFWNFCFYEQIFRSCHNHAYFPTPHTPERIVYICHNGNEIIVSNLKERDDDKNTARTNCTNRRRPRSPQGEDRRDDDQGRDYNSS